MQHDEREYDHDFAEGDLEYREREQEQAARLAEYQAEQDQEAEDPYGDHWQKLMKGNPKSQLIGGLKNCLQREQKAQATLRSQAEEIERLRAVIRAWEATETALSAEITRLKY